MTRHDLAGLDDVIHLKADLLRTLAGKESGEWPRHLEVFVARVDRSALRDLTALVVLLADLRAEIGVLAAARGVSSGQPDAVDDKPRWTDMTRSDQLAWFQADVTGAARPARAAVASGRSALVDDTVRFIDEHYAERVTIGLLASALSRSKRELVTMFRRETGQTIHQYLTQVRMRRSMELIEQREKIEAVSLMVGYRSRKNFYRQFKAVVGLTPVAYRTRALK
jgi:AraC-like DNA-binding protein